jgi:hypothetical protein
VDPELTKRETFLAHALPLVSFSIRSRFFANHASVLTVWHVTVKARLFDIIGVSARVYHFPGFNENTAVDLIKE